MICPADSVFFWRLSNGITTYLNLGFVYHCPPPSLACICQENINGTGTTHALGKELDVHLPTIPGASMQFGDKCKHQLHPKTLSTGPLTLNPPAVPNWSFQISLDYQQFLVCLCRSTPFSGGIKCLCLWCLQCPFFFFLFDWMQVGIVAHQYWQFYILKNELDSQTLVLMWLRSAHSWFLSDNLKNSHGTQTCSDLLLWMRNQSLEASAPESKSLFVGPVTM